MSGVLQTNGVSVILSYQNAVMTFVLGTWPYTGTISCINDLYSVNKEAFNEMSGKLKDEEHRTHYATIRSWFVKTFPTYEEYSPIDAIVARARKKAEPMAHASQV